LDARRQHTAKRFGLACSLRRVPDRARAIRRTELVSHGSRSNAPTRPQTRRVRPAAGGIAGAPRRDPLSWPLATVRSLRFEASALTHMLVVSDVERSREWNVNVLDAQLSVDLRAHVSGCVPSMATWPVRDVSAECSGLAHRPRPGGWNEAVHSPWRSRRSARASNVHRLTAGQKRVLRLDRQLGAGSRRRDPAY
jgi:hypothetical protein